MGDGTTIHAFGDDALGDHDGIALAGLIRSRELGRGEVVEAAIARAEAVQGELNAVQLAAYDRARVAAASPTAGPFSGVPTFIKDNTDVAGLPSNHGSPAFTGKPAKHDGPVTKQLLGTGLVALGKSTMPEFGLGATTEQVDGSVTRNPWNTDFSAGASSGGAAVLVASGVVPIAHANDGGGSTRLPAACCGLVGLKPTRGRFAPDLAARVLPVSIVAEGVVTRSVRDTAHLYAGAEQVWRAKRLPAVGLVEGPSTRRLRIGLVLDSITDTPTDDETRAAVLDAAALLEGMGHTVVPLELPFGKQFADDFGVYWGMAAALLVRLGKQLMAPDFDAARCDPLTRGLADHWRTHRSETVGAIRRLRASSATYAGMFREHDLVLSPTLAHTTPEIGFLSPGLPFDVLWDRLNTYVAFTPLNNATGGPGLSLPLGESGLGLPIGVHLSAAHGDERTLLEIAYEVEEARPWRRIQDRPGAAGRP